MIQAVTLDQVMHQWAQTPMSIVKPEIVRIRKPKGYSVYRLQLVEVWPDDLTAIMGASKLDERVEWAYVTLRSWKSAKRAAWDIWVFSSKREAEKFVTLYNLVWS